MNELIYQSDEICLYFSYCLWEFIAQRSISDCHPISYEKLIEEINKIPDWSEAQKRHAIIHFGKKAGIIKEIA